MASPIIAIVGMSGAGKSEAAKRFVGHGYAEVYFGQITMDELEKRGLPVNEANERAVREGFRKDHGMAAFAVLNMPKIDALQAEGKMVLIDGLYSWSEYKLLKDKYGDELKVVAIYAAPQERYVRLANRQPAPGETASRKNRSLTREEAHSRDFAEIENIEKAGPIAMADFTIVNMGTLEDLTNAVNDLQKQLAA